MAQVRVGLAQASSGQLPPVCICCGGPATRVVHHKFYYQPTWLVIARCFLGYLINLAVGAYRNVHLNVPVCDRHSGRLKLPTYLTYAVLAWLLLGIMLSIVATVLGAGVEINALGGYVALVFFLPLLPMLIGLMALQIFTPRTEYFDNQVVGFTAVAPQFAQALGQGHFSSAGTQYDAPQYDAPQPQYGAPSGFKPYAGVAGPSGSAPRQGGISPLVLALVIVGVIVVGLALVGGVGLVGLAMLTYRARPLASAPPPAFSSPDRVPSAFPPQPQGEPRSFDRPRFERGLPGTPSGSAATPTSSAPTSSAPPSSTPSSTAPPSGVPGPADPFSTSGQPPFGSRIRGPRGPSGARMGETVFGGIDSSGRATRFPENSAPVTSSTKLVRGDKVWGLDVAVWRRAEVLENGTATGAKIHWVGWSDSWDQVLPFEKLRLPDSAVAATTPNGSTTPKGSATPNEPTPEKRPAAAADVRTWTDFTGKFKIEAEFVSFDKGMVMLKKTDGTTTSISLARLSPADQQYVFERITARP